MAVTIITAAETAAAFFDSPDEISHMPYYVQIKCYLRQVIKDIGPDALIPGEKELAEKFGVSRGTAKQAIMDLVYEGILYRKQGKGTFTASHIARSDDRLFYHQLYRAVNLSRSKPLNSNNILPTYIIRRFFNEN